MKIPDRMHDVHSWLPSSKLIPLDLQPAIGDLVVEKNMILKGDEVVQRHTGTQGSIVFIVRRPGWVLCREHGQQLTDLKQKKFAAEKQQDNTDGNNGNNTKNSDNQYLEGFELFGIVKETGVDDAGLTEFYKDYYPFPLYRDENLDFYRSFGESKKITDEMSWTMLLNPFKIYSSVKNLGNRMKSKGIEGNMIGEGLKTGGIIIFDTNGQPKYCYPEITGSELVVDDLLAAVQSVRDGNYYNEDGSSEL